MFKSYIQGIPCQIKVTMYRPIIPASFHGPEEGGEFEYEVYDRKGYKADWLERKITEEDEKQIFSDFESASMDREDRKPKLRKDVRLRMQTMQ